MKQIVSMMILLFLIASCNRSEHHVDSPVTTEDFSKSKSLSKIAGQDLYLTFYWEGDATHVYWTGLTSHHLVEAQVEGENLRVTIPKKLTSRAGVYRIIALQNNTLYQLAEVSLISGLTSGKITAYIGPKSIINDGTQESEITAFPIDSFRNPTGTNSSIDLKIIDDGIQKNEILNLENDYVIKKFTSNKGKSVIAGINSNQAFSETNQIRTMSLCPVDIKLNKENNSYVADGQQFFKVWTDFLRDENGQQISDGTAAKFRVLSTSAEIGEYQAYSVNGIVSCWIKNPTSAGNFELEIKICDQKKIIQLGQFSGLVTNFDYKWQGDQIAIGPITNSIGQFISDGSPVSITLEKDSIVQTIEKHLLDGFAYFDADEFWVKELPKNGTVEINEISYKIRPSKI